MSESIQNLPDGARHPDPGCGGCAVATDHDARRRWLLAAAELYGCPLAVDLDELDALEALDALDDRTAVLLAFPWLSDAELVEALWAVGVATARP